MVRSILVPLDGSAFGEHALPLAMTMAKHMNASLNLIHVHSLLDATYAELQVFDNSLDQELRNKEREYLHEIQKKVQDRLSVPVTIRTVDGDVATAIREQTANLQSSWVVLATHGRGPMGRFWLGSVADELARTVPLSLVFVHPGAGTPDLAQEAPIQHMLVALDGTPLAEQILEPALTVGLACNADFTFLRVVTPVYPMTLPAEPAIFGSVATDVMDRVEKIHADLKHEAETYLNRIATQLREQHPGIRIQTRIVIEEKAAAGILESAKTPIDMVALESHGRGGLSRLLLGSVADELIRTSTIPVLMHKPSEPRTT